LNQKLNQTYQELDSTEATVVSLMVNMTQLQREHDTILAELNATPKNVADLIGVYE